MEIPRPRVESEIQLLAYATAIATPDLSLVCDLHHISWQRRILNPPREYGRIYRRMFRRGGEFEKH